MNIVCLFVEDFLVALARRDRPELQGCPVVVGGSPEEHAEVKACSREAAAAGVVVGTTLRRALSLCPNAVFLALEDRHALAEAERLNAVLRAHSPAVEVIAPGHIHADVQGLAKMTGQGEYDYLYGLYEAASLTCRLPVRIGAASTVFAAHAAALHPQAGPDPVRLVQDEEAAAFIGALPIEVLPLPPQVHQRLRLFGLERLAQLAALSLSAVQAQFGKAGARAWELAQGKDESGVVPQREEVSIAEELDLPAPTALYEPLIAGTRALLQRALGRGDVRGHSLRRMDWRVALESGEVVYRKFVFREPTNDLTRMLFVARSKIERLQLTAAAVSLQVTLSGLCSEYGHQANLWHTGPRRQKELMEAVEQLNAREGGAQVFRIVEVQPWSRIPERQLALIAFGP